MTEQEQVWLMKCKDNPEKYKIVVDNDCIWIEDIDEDESVFDFCEYGQYFIIDLLNALGFKCSGC